MKIIVISTPQFLEHEAEYIHALLDNGADRVHLRKPGSDIEDFEKLVETIRPEYYSRLTVTDHFETAGKFGLGIHTNSRNSRIPEGFQGLKSASCHSLDEIRSRKARYDYLFLSPIFDSISKQGYRSAFSEEDLGKAREEGLIDSGVIALGGINPGNFSQLQEWGFGGGALMGAVWGKDCRPESVETVIENLRSFLKIT